METGSQGEARAEVSVLRAVRQGMYRRDNLEAAWQRVRANQGSAGRGRGRPFETLKRRKGEWRRSWTKSGKRCAPARYRPQPVRRVYIPKANGKMRPLGIPCVRDRVVQMAVLLVIEPIFEAEFLDCSHGFRPGRNARGGAGADRRPTRKAGGKCTTRICPATLTASPTTH